MSFSLAAIALAPGLALGSFLNVVAARVPLRALDRRRPASACMGCGTEIAWYDNVPLLSYLAAARPLPRAAARRSRCATRPSSSSTALLFAGCFLDFGLTRRRARRGVLLRSRSSPSPRPTSSTGSSRTGSSCPPPAVVLVAQTALHPSAEWALGRLRRLRSSSSLAALAYPERDGHGRRQARAAARRDARPHRAGRAVARHARARSCPSIVLFARHGRQGAQDGDPVRAVPGARRASSRSSPAIASAATAI